MDKITIRAPPSFPPYLSVDLVDGSKVVHALQEDGRLDDLAKGRAGGLEDLTHVGQDLLLIIRTNRGSVIIDPLDVSCFPAKECLDAWMLY